MITRLKTQALDSSVREGIIIFSCLRLFLSLWAVLVLAVVPLPARPDEVLRPYFNQPYLNSGASGYLLGPWQRFDTMHYTRIAAAGYAHESDSVFPPLYPWLVRTAAFPLGGSHMAHMAVAVVAANLACLGLLILFHKVAAAELGAVRARRALVYYAIFPTAFFLFAPYTEALFLLLVLLSLWSARHGRFWQAGLWGLLASLTRLTGWVLVAPLLYEWLRQRHDGAWRMRDVAAGTAVLLPGLGTFLFLVYRWAVGLPTLAYIYTTYWYQQTGIPGFDLLRALQTMFLGGPARSGEFTLWFDFFCAILLLATTGLAWKRLGATWSLYATLMLLFMLLPTSELKPLYSFSRYALAFFPTFLLLAHWGQNSWVNRLIFYPSLILYLYFSGQFFMWGWVA